MKLLVEPSKADIEPYTNPPKKIKKGTIGKVNLVLPNGRYHIRIEDKKGNEIAYVAMDEELLEATDKPKLDHEHLDNVEDWGA